MALVPNRKNCISISISCPRIHHLGISSPCAQTESGEENGMCYWNAMTVVMKDDCNG